MRRIPRDDTGIPESIGTAIETHHIEDTDGTWQEIAMPADVESKVILIQIHGTDVTDYDMETACKGFLFSHNETKGWVVVAPEGLMFAATMEEESVIGKIKATAGDKVSLTILD